MDGITGENEDQKRDEEELVSPMIGHVTRSDIESVSYATSGGFLSPEVRFEAEDDDESYACGRPGCPGHVDPPPHTTCIADRDQLTAILLSLKDVEKIKEAAYRAGREDEARSQSAAALDVVMSDGDPAEHNPDWRIGWDRGFVAGKRAGREDAAREMAQKIIDHADRYAPLDGNIQQRRMRRHLMIAVQVVSPKPSLEEVAAAVARGDYVACHLDEYGQPVDGDGVQPTEEQRTEDQKRDEEH